MERVTHLIRYEECVHFQSGGAGSLCKEGFNSPVITKAGSPGHVPDTEQLNMSAHWIHIGQERRN